MSTPAERQAKFRAKRREAGLILRHVWVHPSNVELLKNIEDKLMLDNSYSLFGSDFDKKPTKKRKAQ